MAMTDSNTPMLCRRNERIDDLARIIEPHGFDRHASVIEHYTTRADGEFTPRLSLEEATKIAENAWGGALKAARAKADQILRLFEAEDHVGGVGVGWPDLFDFITPAVIDAGAQRLVSFEDGSVWPDSWDAGQVAQARVLAERCIRSGLGVIEASLRPRQYTPEELSAASRAFEATLHTPGGNFISAATAFLATFDGALPEVAEMPVPGREAELRDLLDDVIVHEVEEDDRVYLRLGSVFIGAFRGIKAAALLKFDAEQRALSPSVTKESERG